SLGKKLFEKYERFKFEPHSDWATYAMDGAGNPLPPGSYGPYATGISEKVRIIYAPEARKVRVMKLEPNVRYRAQAFDPTSGETSELGEVIADKDAAWITKKPKQI